MKFILWASNDEGVPRCDDRGVITSDGVFGRIGLDNVYLTTYGRRPDGSKKYNELEVGEFVPRVRFSLSGGSSYYDVYRVE